MPVMTLIKPSQYHDSAILMPAMCELARLPSITDTAVVIAIEANKCILEEACLLTPAASAASANYLVIAVN